MPPRRQRRFRRSGVPNWDNQVGETMFQEAFEAHPEINAVLAANNGLAQSAITALKNKKVPPKTVPTTGHDATLQGAQNILAGLTVYKPVYEEVAGAVALAIFARAGLTPDAALLNAEADAQSHRTPSLLLTTQSVNATNMEATLIKDKFVDPRQLTRATSRRPATPTGSSEKLAGFDEFSEDNDPHGEHDFEVFEQAGIWMIDYFVA